MNRRDVLTAGAVTLVTPLVPVAAQAATETPVAALYREWQAAFDHEKAVYAASDDFCEDPLCTEASARLLEIEDKMLAAPSRDAQDWLLKLWAVSEGGDLAMTRACDQTLWAEARALVGA